MERGIRQLTNVIVEKMEDLNFIEQKDREEYKEKVLNAFLDNDTYFLKEKIFKPLNAIKGKTFFEKEIINDLAIFLGEAILDFEDCCTLEDILMKLTNQYLDLDSIKWCKAYENLISIIYMIGQLCDTNVDNIITTLDSIDSLEY